MKQVLAALLLLSVAALANGSQINRPDLVGHWRYQDETQSCDYTFAADGSFTGEVKQGNKTISKFAGRWILKGNLIHYHYVSDRYGRIPAGAEDQDQLLSVKRDSFLIQAANGARRRYHRMR